jgi:hypothetical protein
MNKPLSKDGFAEESGNTMIERTEYYRIGRTILFVSDSIVIYGIIVAFFNI